MSQHNRWPSSGGYDTEGNHRGIYQSTRQPGHHHQSRHDRPSARNTWNSPNPSWNREQIQRKSSDINIYTRQQTDGPCYYDQHYGGNERPFSHRVEGLHDPYFMSQQSSSAYAPTCDYIVPMTSLLATPSSSRILETSSIDHVTPKLTSYPQPKVEKQTSPLPEYLEITLEPSTYLYDPTSSRKLLILDLNGTLVFRSPHRRRGVGTNGQLYSHHHHHDNYQSENSRISNERGEPYFDAYADPTVLRPLRPVHPRPFIPSFRQYLFHPKTRLWLDTMVWSSAQPHSVSDMVQRCFGDSKDELVAVWARDTLDLSAEQYYRKTQTTKDLAKPWASLLSPESSEESKDPTPSLPPPNQPRTIHSAHTTLLLDDSPLKAYLQPWNHICIKEYVAEMRSLDVEVAQTRNKSNEASTHGVTEGHANLSVASQAKSDDGVGAEIKSDDQPVEQQDSRKRKRQLKKIAKKENKMISKRQNLPGEKSIGWPNDELTSKQWWRKFDCTLLAVIGVLDAVKRESNVAAWVRKGGLRTTFEEEEIDDMSQMADSKEEKETTDFDSDASTRCVTSPPKTEEEDKDSGKRARRVSAEKSEGLSGNLTMPTKEGLWFEDEQTMSYWIERGIRSLKELHIEVDAGVKVS